MLDKILSPITVEEFFQDNWEKLPLVVNRQSPDYFSHLLSLDTIDQIITTSDMRFPDIRIIDATREITTSEYAGEGGRLKPDRVMKLFHEGGTIVLNHQHKWQPELAKFCRAMEQYFSQPFQTNIYFTPPNAQGFDIHFDTHDVFVLQIAGRKDWQIFNTAIDLPLVGQGENPKPEDIGKVEMECALEAGDLLYIPRGILHKAESTNEISLHATVGVLAKTWADFILEAVSQVMLKDPAFRESMPIGFARADFDREQAKKIFDQKLSDLVASVGFEAALEAFIKNFVDTRPPLLQGQMKQLSQIDTLNGQSRVRLREGIVYRVEYEADTIALSFYGKTIDLPLGCDAALQKVVSGQEFQLDELSDADGSAESMGDTLVLIRRLITEGFVEIIS